ncbi:MAG: pentapeptide repeat-containing protein [Deltaproteobacteria bacterium]|nr:pentapeptide repeat-containing protein [Deltaproteobacteria bacterium]
MYRDAFGSSTKFTTLTFKDRFFSRSIILGSDFSGSDFSGSDFLGSDFLGSDFSGLFLFLPIK